MIELDGVKYNVPSYGYLVEGFNGHTCGVAVSYLGILQDSYVLGDTFIKNFYATFNYQDNTVGLAQNANGPVTYLPLLPWYSWMFIALGGLLLIVLIVAGVFYVRGRGKAANKAVPITSEALLHEPNEDTFEVEKETKVLLTSVPDVEDQSNQVNTKIAHLTDLIT